jgi:hypothetical protein
MDILGIIRHIESGNKAAKTVPSHAMLLEITKIHGNAYAARDELNRLQREGKVKIGDTVNDKYVTIITKE